MRPDDSRALSVSQGFLLPVFPFFFFFLERDLLAAVSCLLSFSLLGCRQPGVTCKFIFDTRRGKATCAPLQLSFPAAVCRAVCVDVFRFVDLTGRAHLYCLQPDNLKRRSKRYWRWRPAVTWILSVSLPGQWRMRIASLLRINHHLSGCPHGCIFTCQAKPALWPCNVCAGIRKIERTKPYCNNKGALRWRLVTGPWARS